MPLRTTAMLIVGLSATAPLLVGSQAAGAASGPVSNPRIVAHFDAAAGQTPEALAIEPDGAVDISLSVASQVVRVTGSGQVRMLAQLPRDGNCPIFGEPITTGLVRLPSGALDVLVCTGNEHTGVWQIAGSRAPVQIAQLPAGSVPNGMALAGGLLYIADSTGAVWRIPADGGPAVRWASGTALDPVSFAGANGCYVQGGAVWVSNTDQGTILRIPILPGGSAGPIRTIDTGLSEGVDNFTVLPGGQILMPLEDASQVVLIQRGGTYQTVLTAADGLSNPVDVKVAGSTLYVADAGYITGVNANLLAANIRL